MLSAIEIYNKPDFHFREETFAILAINARELMLKARLLQLGDNRISTILVYERMYERRQLQDGSLSKECYRNNFPIWLALSPVFGVATIVT